MLQDGGEVITCRPADLIEPEMDKLIEEFRQLAKDEKLQVAEHEIDDVLIYAQFPQVGLHFIKNRNNPDAFEPVPGTEPEPAPVATAAAVAAGGPEQYQVSVNGTNYDVIVSPGGEVTQVQPVSTTAAPSSSANVVEEVVAPMAGNVIEILVAVGEEVADNQPIVIIEAMKMETEIRAHQNGIVEGIHVSKGDAIQVNQPLISIV